MTFDIGRTLVAASKQALAAIEGYRDAFRYELGGTAGHLRGVAHRTAVADLDCAGEINATRGISLSETVDRARVSMRYWPSPGEAEMRNRLLERPELTPRYRQHPRRVNGLPHSVYHLREGERHRRIGIPAKPGELAKREVAAYRLAQLLGFDLVPPTALIYGPCGRGSVQQLRVLLSRGSRPGLRHPFRFRQGVPGSPTRRQRARQRPRAGPGHPAGRPRRSEAQPGGDRRNAEPTRRDSDARHDHRPELAGRDPPLVTVRNTAPLTRYLAAVGAKPASAAAISKASTVISSSSVIEATSAFSRVNR